MMTKYEPFPSVWIESQGEPHEYPVLAPIRMGKPPGHDLPSFVHRTRPATDHRWLRIGNWLAGIADRVAALADFFRYHADQAWGRSYQTVPNPDYDADRAQAFCATHPTRCGTRFFVGQSYNPQPPPPGGE